MRSSEAIVAACHRANLGTFSDDDRARAKIARRIFNIAIKGDGLRLMFDHRPDTFEFSVERFWRDVRNLSALKQEVARFGELVTILKEFGDKTALGLHPRYHLDGPETIIWKLNPRTVATYQHMHEALVAYLNALDSEQPSRKEATEAARKIACIIRPNEWRAIGKPIPGDITQFDMETPLAYLAAILEEPGKPIT